MEISSPAFKHYSMMPSKYTCQGENINPPLEITGVPENTKSLILIVVDPDTPFPIPTVTHWIVCNLDPTITKIDEGANFEKATVGKNVYRRNQYTGPCPPWGTHKYIFKLYALDELLSFNEKITRRKVIKKIKNHIIAQAELIGLYRKQKDGNK